MESWRLIWRNGYAESLPTRGLEALLEALRTDSKELVQGATTSPPPLQVVQDWAVEAADAIAYCGWKGLDLTTVGETEEFFAKAAFEADQRLGEPAACRWFLNWYDDCPRDEMRRELSAEVERELLRRVSTVELPAELQAAIRNSPGDHLPKLAAADYLADCGDEDGAAELRRQAKW